MRSTLEHQADEARIGLRCRRCQCPFKVLAQTFAPFHAWCVCRLRVTGC